MSRTLVMRAKDFLVVQLDEDSLQTQNASNPTSQHNKSQGLKTFGHLQKTLKILKTLGG